MLRVYRRSRLRLLLHMVAMAAIGLMLLLLLLSTAEIPYVEKGVQLKLPTGKQRHETAGGSTGHTPTGVVRIIHQSWKTRQLPPMFARWSQTFSICFPTYRRLLWTDADNRQFIQTHYSWFLQRYDSFAPGVQRADVSRLFYMYHYGGLYCDLDCECVRNFEHLLANTSLALGAMDGKMIHSRTNPAYVEEGQVENSFMYSRPRHPFFWDLILRLNTTRGEAAIMTTGPYHIMSGIKAARESGLTRTLVDGLPYLTVYPGYMFNPYSWIRRNAPACRLFGAFDALSLRRCRNTFTRRSYVIQYHTQVWDKGKRHVLAKTKL